jgi:hypothetical protein
MAFPIFMVTAAFGRQLPTGFASKELPHQGEAIGQSDRSTARF